MLELSLNVDLFIRDRKNIILTQKGEMLHAGIRNNLDQLEKLIEIIREYPKIHQLTLTCSHEISHLYVMPRFHKLQKALGENIDIHILTIEYEQQDLLDATTIDIQLVWHKSQRNNPHHHLLLRKNVTPVCAPIFYQNHRKIIDNFLSEPTNLPLLELAKRNDGWMSWQQFFQHHALGSINMKPSSFQQYAYLLEAASLGRKWLWAGGV